MDITEKVNSIKTRADFVNLIELLSIDLQNSLGEWENKTLPEFLEAIASWTEDMEGYYINNGVSIPENVDWKVFARILTAAKVYE